ncbi:MAG: TIGR00282 family metallophosphoesterase [Hydrogenibacillus schlegelii]|nr:TIGR00282 family metallophosphoesterase [Hydrogenibacillus schlegelii]
MRVLFVGDVVGRPGRKMLALHLPRLIDAERPDFVVVNGENAAHGRGITRKIAADFFALGADVITLGNHAWDNKEAFDLLAEEPRVLRPLNYPPGTAGRGVAVVEKGARRLGVVSVLGRSFMQPLDDPFRALDAALEELAASGVRHVVVDVHAEATAEKEAIGWYVDGRASAVIGTHTHVQTADARLLPGGTAYLTDVGMTGPMDGVLGMRRDEVLARFLTGLPQRFDVLTEGPRELSYAVVDLRPDGRAAAIRRGRIVETPQAEGTYVPPEAQEASASPAKGSSGSPASGASAPEAGAGR